MKHWAEKELDRLAREVRRKTGDDLRNSQSIVDHALCWVPDMGGPEMRKLVEDHVANRRTG